MKKFSGLSAALLVVFMAHMLWAQERPGEKKSQPHGAAAPAGHEQGVGGGHIPQHGPTPMRTAPAPQKPAHPQQGEQ